MIFFLSVPRNTLKFVEERRNSGSERGIEGREDGTRNEEK
jgi:hypothetical protein